MLPSRVLIVFEIFVSFFEDTVVHIMFRQREAYKERKLQNNSVLFSLEYYCIYFF